MHVLSRKSFLCSIIIRMYRFPDECSAKRENPLKHGVPFENKTSRTSLWICNLRVIVASYYSSWTWSLEHNELTDSATPYRRLSLKTVRHVLLSSPYTLCFSKLNALSVSCLSRARAPREESHKERKLCIRNQNGVHFLLNFLHLLWLESFTTSLMKFFFRPHSLIKLCGMCALECISEWRRQEIKNAICTPLTWSSLLWLFSPSPSAKRKIQITNVMGFSVHTTTLGQLLLCAKQNTNEINTDSLPGIKVPQPLPYSLARIP